MKEQAIKTLKNLIALIWGFNVEIEGSINEKGIDLKIVCDDKIKPFLVGRKGRIIRLLRRIMKVWGTINKCNVNIQKI